VGIARERKWNEVNDKTTTTKTGTYNAKVLPMSFADIKQKLSCLLVLLLHQITLIS